MPSSGYSFTITPDLTYPTGTYTLDIRIHIMDNPNCVNHFSDERLFSFIVVVTRLNKPPYYESSVVTSYTLNIYETKYGSLPNFIDPENDPVSFSLSNPSATFVSLIN